MKYNSHISRLIKLSQKIRYRLILEGVLIGITAGLVTSLYRLILSHTEKFSQFIYSFAKINVWSIAALFAGLIIIGLICGILIKSEPMIKGSGIPQVEGTILGYFNPNWLKVLIKKFICGILSIGAGLSLGREGPSIQLGASVGQGFSKIFHRIKFEEKYLITCGASAGLAAAFNAPLAGVLFSVEEVHKHFSPNILLSAMAASISADFISKNIFGMQSVFNTMPLPPIHFKYYPILLLLALFCGILGAIYNKTLIKTQDLYARLPVPEIIKPVIACLFAGIFGITLPAVLGGGHGIITGIINNQYIIWYMLLLLAAKFIFSMISFGSGTSGGIFFPLLVLGALSGAIFGKISSTYLALPQEYIVTFMLLGMVALFTSIVRAPITGIILIIEMSGSLSYLLSLTMVAVISYLTVEVFNIKPIYELLLERITDKKDKHIKTETTLLEFTVTPVSHISGKKIKNIKLPDECLIAGISRIGKEFLPKDETVIQSGDIITILCSTKNEAYVKEEIERLTTRKIKE